MARHWACQTTLGHSMAGSSAGKMASTKANAKQMDSVLGIHLAARMSWAATKAAWMAGRMLTAYQMAQRKDPTTADWTAARTDAPMD